MLKKPSPLPERIEKFKVLFGDNLSGSLNVSVPTEVPFKVFSAMLKLESLTTGFSFTSRTVIFTIAVSFNKSSVTKTVNS